jgi:hypothetical protein
MSQLQVFFSFIYSRFAGVLAAQGHMLSLQAGCTVFDFKTELNIVRCQIFGDNKGLEPDPRFDPTAAISFS